MLEKLGITELNDMQRETGEAILHGKRDVVVLSPTGSGKTLAYLLPLVQLMDAQSDEVQAIVVVPGRELALQSHRVLKDMGSGLRSDACYGGRTAMEEHRRLKAGLPQIVFGTPGRLNDHLDKSNISPYGVRYLVIDEYDKCLEMGFRDEMASLLKKLPGVRRRILLSATACAVSQGPWPVDHLWQRIDYLQSSPGEMFNTRESADEGPRVELFEVKSPVKDKLGTLRQLLCKLGDEQGIVFLSYRDAVERVGDYLRREGFAASVFHGGMDQKQREDALYKFSNGSANVLVCTDLASRGLDIPDIKNVIHYHLPLNEQELVHRVGRTARWDKRGRAFFIVGPEEHVPGFAGVLSAFDLQGDVPPIPQPAMATLYIGKGKKDKLSKGDIVGFLCKKGGLESSEIGRIDVMDRYVYAAVSRPKLQQVLRLTKGEKIKGVKTVIEAVK